MGFQRLREVEEIRKKTPQHCIIHRKRKKAESTREEVGTG